MSGHSKWANIQHRKGRQDAKRSNLWTKLVREIMVAARNGADPDSNSRLRLALLKARAGNVPKDTIKNAILKGSGQLEGVKFEEARYEGYGVGGAALIIDAATDNRTRTVADVRSVFNKFGGNLGTMGSLAFLFDHKCMFTFKKKDGMDMEEFILDMIDFDIDEDYEEDEEEGTITIYGDPKSYAAIQKHLEEGGFEDVGGEFTYIANDLKDVEPAHRETIDKMVERLEEFDDVQTVYTNMKPEESEE